ncbi:MAG: XRE family transcriptional regulator [Chloroflexota bacterium]|nr:MAG: XRE family transcriptional regulator [Chloroflexota bacterium]
MKTSARSDHDATEKRRIRAAEFAWDLAAQLAALRAERGLTQAQLAEKIGTRQQAISRLENPVHGRQSLTTLRQVASTLNAHVDVAIVPDEVLDTYCQRRYLPLIQEEPEEALAQLTA